MFDVVKRWSALNRCFEAIQQNCYFDNVRDVAELFLHFRIYVMMSMLP